MSAFTDIVGFVRSVNDRKKANVINEDLKDYINNPDMAIANVNETDPRMAIALTAQHAQEQAAIRAQRAEAAATATGYLRALPQGSDYGATIDKMAPFLANTLQMRPEEIIKYRDAIVANPYMITSLDDDANKARATAQYGIQKLGPGDVAMQGGKVTYRNPYAPVPVQARRGDGGVEYRAFDPNTQSFTGDGGGPTPADASVAPGGPANTGGGAPPISVRLNNPGALRPDGKSKWRGATGESGGFVQFDTPENGRRAQIINLQNQRRLHGITTLNQLTAKYAPTGDNNDPAAYAARIGQAVGVDPNAAIDLSDPNVAASVADAMAGVESGNHAGTVTGATVGQPSGGRVSSFSTAGKPAKGFRAARPDELTGYPPGTMAQVDTETGEMKNIRTPAAGVQTANVKQAEAYRTAVDRKSALDDSLDMLTGSVQAVLDDPNLDSYVGNVSGALPSFLSQGRRTFNNNLEALKTQVGLGALQQMREMSKTGGALGQVSNYENRMLQRALSSLETTNDPVTFRKNLNTVMAYARRAKARTATALQRMPGAAQPDQSGGAQGGGHPVGQMAVKRDAQGNITARVRWDGKAWRPVK